MATPLPTAGDRTVRIADKAHTEVLLDAKGDVLGFFEDGVFVHVLAGGPSTRGFHFYESFIRCPRHYALARHMALWVDTPPLIKGTLGHAGAAQYRARQALSTAGSTFTCNGVTLTAREQLARPAAVARVLAYVHGDAWVAHLDEAVTGIQAYVDQTAGARLDVVFIETEMKLRVHVARWLADQPFLYTQRGDWGSRDQARRVRLHDVKFIQRYRTTTMNRYKLSGQMIGYYIFGKRLWGEKFAGVVIEFVELSSGRVISKVWPFAPNAINRYMTDLGYWERNRRELDGLMTAGQLEPHEFPGSWSEHACNGPYGLCPGADPALGDTCGRGFTQAAVEMGRARLAARQESD